VVVVGVMNVHDISVHYQLWITLSPPPAHPTVRAKGYLEFLNNLPPEGELSLPWSTLHEYHYI